MAAVGVGSSIASGIQSANAAGDAKDANAAQIQLAYNQWNKFLETLAPLEAEAALPVEQQPGFARMMATIDRGYSDLGANVRRTMGGRYPHGSGLERMVGRNVELSRTRTKAGAYADAADNRWNRMLGVASLTRGLPATSTANLAGGARGLGGLAAMQGASAAGAWQNTAGVMNDLGQLWMMRQPQLDYSRLVVPQGISGAGTVGDPMIIGPYSHLN